MADIRALPKPLLDHTPIMWHSMKEMRRPTYFKLDRLTLLGGSLKETMAQWWATHSVDRQDLGGLADKLTGVRLFLKELQRQEQVAHKLRGDQALSQIKTLDDAEDLQLLTKDKECK